MRIIPGNAQDIGDRKGQEDAFASAVWEIAPSNAMLVS